jgi:F-type H+-transporting ATPase subunit delta
MAGRYATALFELALEANALDAVKANLEAFDALIAQSADLARLVRSPVFSSKVQVRALGAVPPIRQSAPYRFAFKAASARDATAA